MNSVLSSILIYYLSFYSLLARVIKKINSIRKKFLWEGADGKLGSYYLVSWGRVCKYLSQGGLGVLDLRDFNRALLEKWWWRL